jgi:hypothetical protein
MCQFSYVLIALLALNLADDCLVPGLGSLSAPLADDDNEYLLPEREQGQQWSACKKPGFATLSHRAPAFFSSESWPPAESHVTARGAPPPLYVLMSLQI